MTPWNLPATNPMFIYIAPAVMVSA